MSNDFFILADGIPAPLIFFGFVALIMLLSGVLGSTKKPTPPVPLGGARAEADRRRRAEAQRRVLQQRGTVPPPPMPTAQNKRQSSARKAAQRVAIAQPQTRLPAAPRPVVVTPIASRPPQNETARNLKLMLQRGGIREAVLLGEILGKPKSLRDDA